MAKEFIERKGERGYEEAGENKIACRNNGLKVLVESKDFGDQSTRGS